MKLPLLFLHVLSIVFHSSQHPGDLQTQKAEDFYSKKQYDSSAYFYHLAAQEYLSTDSLEKYGITLHNLARVYYRDYKDSACLASIKKAIETFTELQKSSPLAASYNRYGVYLSGMGKNKESLEAYKNSLKYGISANDSTSLAYTYNNIGLVYEELGDYQASLEALYKALEFKERLGMKTSGTLLNLGVTLDLLGFFDRSIHTYKQAIREKYREQDTLGAARVLSNLAVIYKNQEKYDSAIYYIEESNGILANYPDESLAYVNLTNLGNLYKRQGDPDKGLDLLQQALSIAKAQNNVNSIGDTYQNIGNLYYDLGDYGEAIVYFQEALDLTDFTKSNSQLHEINYKLFEAYNALSEPSKALQYLIRSNQYRDSLFRFEQVEAIEELQTKYETEQKEQQIKLQNIELVQKELVIRQNRYLLIGAAIFLLLLIIIGLLMHNRMKLRQQQLLQEERARAREAQIQAVVNSQEKERNRFARDLHDTFGQLISVLHMSLDGLKKHRELSLEDRNSIFEDSVGILDDMYAELKNICFDLMPQSLVMSGLKSALEEFTIRLNSLDKITIELNIFGGEKRLSELLEISFYRITQEWVNNILKYSDATLITLQLTIDGNEITLLIEDNGSGFDKNILTKKGGNGWKNIQTRASLIHGEIELDTLPERRGNTLIVNAAFVNEAIKEKIPS